MFGSYIEEHYGDLASVVGVAVSIVGFIWTILGVRKAERAAEDAKTAAKEQLGRFQGQLLLDVLTSVFRSLKEIERARGENRWLEAQTYCAQARSELCEITMHKNLSKEERAEILSNINQLATMQETLEKLKKTSASTNKLSRDVLEYWQELILSIGRMKSGIESANLEIIT
ncbi:MAG: hypothetical protein NVSMB14_08430 [Isosphaeraceae bacterium]